MQSINKKRVKNLIIRFFFFVFYPVFVWSIDCIAISSATCICFMDIMLQKKRMT